MLEKRVVQICILVIIIGLLKMVYQPSFSVWSDRITHYKSSILKWVGVDSHNVVSHDSFQLVGDENYIQTVRQCLTLIASKAEDEYRFIQQQIDIIEQGKSKYVFSDTGPTRYLMSRLNANYSPSWCASTIANGAYYYYLKKTKVNSMKGDVYMGKRFPSTFDFQLLVLIKVGGTITEASYLESEFGAIADVNGDQQINEKDYLVDFLHN